MWRIQPSKQPQPPEFPAVIPLVLTTSPTLHPVTILLPKEAFETFINLKFERRRACQVRVTPTEVSVPGPAGRPRRRPRESEPVTRTRDRDPPPGPVTPPGAAGPPARRAPGASE
eukprot:765747-Hanusia_phi.AAC.3